MAPARPADVVALAALEALAFLERIEGSGYGGMSDYDCAVASLRSALRAGPTEQPDPLRETDQPVELVLVDPDDLQELIRQAYLEGCRDVHRVWEPDEEGDFTEAAYDYVASLDFTETTKPYRASPPSPPAVWSGEDISSISQSAATRDHSLAATGAAPSALVRKLDELAEFYRYRPVSRDAVPSLEEMTRRECEVLFATLDEAARRLAGDRHD